MVCPYNGTLLSRDTKKSRNYLVESLKHAKAKEIKTRSIIYCMGPFKPYNKQTNLR